MMDRISKDQRSLNMSHIRGSDTGLEIEVRKHLHNCGFRYRKNVKTLPGKPDIVLHKYKSVIFVNGCFWHHHKNCKLAYMPKTNTDFWIDKFKRNVRNDKRHSRELRKMGYHVITIWECKLKKDFDGEMRRVTRILHKYGGIDKAS